MRTVIRSLTPSALLLLCSICSSSSLLAQRVTYEEFLTKVSEALRFDDQQTLDLAVRDNALHAVKRLRNLYFSERGGSQSGLEEAQKIADAWERKFEGSNTPHKLRRWILGLDTTRYDLVVKLEQQMWKAWGHFADNNRSIKFADQTIENLTTVVRHAEQCGDLSNQAEAWSLINQAWQVKAKVDPTHQKDVLFAGKQFLVAREALEFRDDSIYKQYKDYVERVEKQIHEQEAARAKREGEGYGDDASPVDALLMPQAERRSFNIASSVMSKPKKVEVGLRAAGAPPQWFRTDIVKNGPTRIAHFKARDLFLVRAGASKFGISLRGDSPDLDQLGWKELKASNRLRRPSVISLDDKGSETYAMWFFLGGQSEPFQGITQNFGPTPDRTPLFIKSAMVWDTSIDGESVKIWDENLTGRLFDDPEDTKLELLLLADRPGKDPRGKVDQFDAIQVGRGPVHPLGNWVKIGTTWWRLEGADDGKSVNVRQTNPEYFKTGSLELAFEGRGITVNSLVVQGRIGPMKNARFNLAGGKAVEVPAGEYDILFGQISSGRGARRVTAWVFKGNADPLTVEEGETATVSLGAPFSIDFIRDGNKIDATTIKVVGQAGEIYTYINGAVPEAEILAARDESGKGRRAVGELSAVASGEVLNRYNEATKLGPDVGFFPKVDGVTPATAIFKYDGPDGMKLGLAQKKNALFGELKAIWH